MKYPKGETVWVTYMSGGKPTYIVTSTKVRDKYFLYKVSGESMSRIAKADNPDSFDKIVKEGA